MLCSIFILMPYISHDRKRGADQYQGARLKHVHEMYTLALWRMRFAPRVHAAV